MKIILSPAKKMRTDQDGLDYKDLPQYMEQTREILAWLQSMTHEELKALWKCNDAIAQQNFERLEQLKKYNCMGPEASCYPESPEQVQIAPSAWLTPAVLAYDGIAYQYMAPAVFEYDQLEYIQEHLRILSAFYGVLRPMDGVTPYRLELGSRIAGGKGPCGCRDLYEFWGSRLYEGVSDESGIIINLASKEYFKAVQKYLALTDRFITITFCEEVKGKLVTKGTYAKMARGDMVRFMAENRIEDPADLKNYNRMNYHFREELSSEEEYVFIRQ